MSASGCQVLLDCFFAAAEPGGMGATVGLSTACGQLADRHVPRRSWRWVWGETDNHGDPPAETSRVQGRSSRHPLLHVSPAMPGSVEVPIVTRHGLNAAHQATKVALFSR